MQLILTAISLGFIGSFHCVGMCGPIALALPLNQRSYASKLRGIILYNTGRTFTYAVFGGLFGLLGQSLVIAGYQQMVSISLGLALLVMVILPNRIFSKYKLTGFIYSYIGKLKQTLGSLFKKNSNSSLFFIGTLNGLLPCGLVYLGIAGAIATGNSLQGSLFMAMFGLGTLPAMFTLSMLGNSISINVRNKMNKAIPVFVAGTALMLILRGMNLGIPYISPEMSATKPVAHNCCHK
jgi:uncharacterized protein